MKNTNNIQLQPTRQGTTCFVAQRQMRTQSVGNLTFAGMTGRTPFAAETSSKNPCRQPRDGVTAWMTGRCPSPATGQPVCLFFVSCLPTTGCEVPGLASRCFATPGPSAILGYAYMSLRPMTNSAPPEGPGVRPVTCADNFNVIPTVPIHRIQMCPHSPNDDRGLVMAVRSDPRSSFANATCSHPCWLWVFVFAVGVGVFVCVYVGCFVCVCVGCCAVVSKLVRVNVFAIFLIRFFVGSSSDFKQPHSCEIQRKPMLSGQCQNAPNLGVDFFSGALAHFTPFALWKAQNLESPSGCSKPEASPPLFSPINPRKATLSIRCAYSAPTGTVRTSRRVIVSGVMKCPWPY